MIETESPGTLGELSENDCRRTAELARTAKATWVVIDHYGASGLYLEALGKAPWRCLLIEDEPRDGSPPADLLVNFNLGIPPGAYEGRTQGSTLLGPYYALVKECFVQLRKESLSRRGGPLRRLLVVLGGSGAPEPGFHRTLVEHLAPAAEIAVVTGPAMDPPASGFAEESGLVLLGPLRPPELAAEICAAQAAIATPSTICWEMATLGMPMALVRRADNQVSADELEKIGAALLLLPGEPLAVAFAGDKGLSSERVRLRLSSAAASMVDGSGASRVVSAMEQISA